MKGFAGAVIGLAACLAAPLTADATAQRDFEHLVRRSPFIFIATVTKLRAATMPIVPVSERTIVVRVDDVVRGPSLFAHYAGKEITVHIGTTETPKVGEQLTFFATGWLLGENLALQENMRLQETDLAGLSARVTTALQRLADQELRERVKGADLVVVGRVSRILARPDGPGPRGEHDPEWRTTVLDVAAVLKGPVAVKRVEVLFAGSEDVAWFRAPKFSVGQEGIWILRWERQLRAYVAVDPLDFQPREALDRIKRHLTPGEGTPRGAKPSGR